MAINDKNITEKAKKEMLNLLDLKILKNKAYFSMIFTENEWEKELFKRLINVTDRLIKNKE